MTKGIATPTIKQILAALALVLEIFLLVGISKDTTPKEVPGKVARRIAAIKELGLPRAR